jgi:NADPH:quinone reductase-like Zn-dependent oxidoreductase
MKETIVSPTKPLISAHIREVDIPVPKDNEILIRVVVAASNPKGALFFHNSQP